MLWIFSISCSIYLKLKEILKLIKNALVFNSIYYSISLKLKVILKLIKNEQTIINILRTFKIYPNISGVFKLIYYIIYQLKGKQ